MTAMSQGTVPMLPDYPKTKELIDDMYRKWTDLAKKRRLGIFSEIKQSQIPEGSKSMLTRSDGSSEVFEMERLRASEELPCNVREIEKRDPDEIMQFLLKLGEQMADKQVKLCMKRIDEAVNEVGNIVDSNKPFSEQYLEMLEKIQFDFNSDGTPSLPQMVVGSQEAVVKMKSQLEQMFNDPVLKKRHDGILELKRQEWRDRETARNLVE